ncbi:MAG: S49 family peptidase [Chloroflexi bacterium]|nr:S49 family peptidase [Chloroflexota bacterium]
MDESNRSDRSPLTIILLLILVVLLPLGLGILAAPRIVPKPQIGVIRLSYDIASDTAFEITEQLAYARQDPAIKAVVLVINSPGGSAAYSEELFLDVLETRRQMPVVASIDLLAASGAYYMAAAADEIYAKPTSSVGSIGVIAFLPGDVFIEEDLLTTGPFKAFGGTRDGAVRQIERAKFAFLQAVETGRGDRLTIDRQTLSRAEVYTGVQALEFGMIDGLAANEEVVRRAAELAGIRGYDTLELYPLAFPNVAGLATAVRVEPLDVARLWAAPSNLAPGLYYRHVEPFAGN